jgi:hypothetical protein
MKDRFCFRAETLPETLPDAPSSWGMDEEERRAIAHRLFSDDDNDNDLWPHEKEIKERYVNIMRKSSDPLTPRGKRKF